eukprot:3934060-Rhodomonas_salina.1
MRRRDPRLPELLDLRSPTPSASTGSPASLPVTLPHALLPQLPPNLLSRLVWSSGVAELERCGESVRGKSASRTGWMPGWVVDGAGCVLLCGALRVDSGVLETASEGISGRVWRSQAGTGPRRALPVVGRAVVARRGARGGWLGGGLEALWVPRDPQTLP